MRSMRNFSNRIVLPVVCLLALVIFAGGCAGKFGRKRKTDRLGSEIQRSDRSDPLAFAGDDQIVTEQDIGLRDYSIVEPDSVDVASPIADHSDSTAVGAGYDVRFFATLNIYEARRVQQQLDTLTQMPVRVVFEEPYYKLKAGPYRSFAEAERVLRVVTRLGYSSAWIVGHQGNKGE